MRPMFNGAALGVAAALLLAGSSAAGVTVLSLPDGSDPGPAAGETLEINFDDGLPTGVALFGNAAIETISLAGHYAAPAGDTTPYLATPVDGAGGAATLNFGDFLGGRDVTHFSFYWGSIDTFNTVQLLDRLGNQIAAFSGASLMGTQANGDWTSPITNRRVWFTLTGPDRDLGGLLFTSTSPAFEIDRIAFAPVPEAEIWGLMLAGFGLAGAALRRRRLAAA